MRFAYRNAIFKRILSIDSDVVHCEKRGFRRTILTTHHESIGRFFLQGYHDALDVVPPIQLYKQLRTIGPRYQGFAFEGAAMAFWLLDSLSLLRRDRWSHFLQDTKEVHPYVVHVGAGWSLARLPWYRRNPERAVRHLDPFLRWLVIDGFGFHEGYFRASKWIHNPVRRPILSDYGNRAFDQGLGRSLWFVEGADATEITRTIRSFDLNRQPDLWSGVGLACAYAGQASVPELESLMVSAQSNLAHLRQGVTFGAEARVRGEISDEHTERTCEVVCGMSAESAAALTQMAKADVESASESHGLPQYELWRRRVRESLSEEARTCV